jgi:hypothetical protein
MLMITEEVYYSFLYWPRYLRVRGVMEIIGFSLSGNAGNGRKYFFLTAFVFHPQLNNLACILVI